jgi:hypothetical protein
MLDKTPTHRITTEEMVQHMFFAEINWYKLVAKQCIPPKLVQRFGLKAAAQTASTSNLLDVPYCTYLSFNWTQITKTERKTTM